MNEGEDQSARQPHSGAPFANAVPIERMTGDDEQDRALLEGMARQAAEYLMSFDWCVSIVDTYFGDGIGGIVAVFLSRILSARVDVDGSGSWWAIYRPLILTRKTSNLRMKRWTSTYGIGPNGPTVYSLAVPRQMRSCR
jgi:hypothetical protein